MAEKSIDEYSGLEIRKTDNGMRDCDIESPQFNRLLTEDEIAAIIAKAGERDGDA